MIKIKVIYDDSYVKSVRITGHAMYDVKGKDIVCASVSTLAISSINLCISLDETAISYKDDEGLLEINVLKKDGVINNVLLNMINMFKELEKDYSKNIKFI